MESLKYVNPKTGHTGVPTETQLKIESGQILLTEGIEALLPPEVWVGNYNEEKIFHPVRYVSLKWQQALQRSNFESETAI